MTPRKWIALLAVAFLAVLTAAGTAAAAKDPDRTNNGKGPKPPTTTTTTAPTTTTTRATTTTQGTTTTVPTTLLNPYITTTTGGGGGSGDTFYLTTTGNDSNPGSEASPWLTFDHALAQLGAGDTLIVGGGTYHESNLGVTADGTAEDPITIIAKEGETPIIDGSMSAYRPISNSAWEVFDAGRNIYRTTATLGDPGEFGYTGRIDVSGTLYMLTSYRGGDLNGGTFTGLDFLSADTDLYDVEDPYYMGPGITHAADGKVYIRLAPNTAEAHWDVIATPFEIADKDPRNHAIYIAPNNGGIAIDGDYVTVDGIELRHHWATFGGTGANVTIQNLTIRPSRFGARVGGNGWTFDNVTMEFDRPEWLSRSDVKGFGEPAKDTRTGGIDWEGHTGTFTDGTIHGAFDGMLVLTNEHDVTVTGSTFDGSMDDGIQMGSAAYNIEFGHNLFINGAGPSHDGSGSDSAATPDTVYVHHNVFDNTTPVFWARKPVPGVDPAENGTGGYLSAPVISSHGVPDFGDPWKIYNNTFVAEAGSGVQGVLHYLYQGASPSDGVHEAYNNLINMPTSDTRVYRYANASTGKELYDYNIYARATPLGQFAIEVVDETGTPQAVINDFSTWQSLMGTFDANSIHQTTQVSLNGSYQPAIAGPADGTGTDLSATGWPGTSPGTDYIGAKAPV